MPRQPNQDDRPRTAKALAESLLDEHRKAREGVTAGSCMWPFLPAGVRTTPVDRPPRMGSVAVYRSGSGLCAHRVVGIFDGGVFTRSDRPGARLERVDADRIVGLWERGAGLRTIFLQPSVGAVVARLGLALSRPAPLDLLRSVWHRLPVLPPLGLDTRVFVGEAARLALLLTKAGMGPRASSLEALEAAYLRPTAGFVVIARSAGRPIGASTLAAPSHLERGDRPSREVYPAILTLGVRRRHLRPEVLDALLRVTLDEAAHRGFAGIEVEAEAAPGGSSIGAEAGYEGLEAEALRRHGFVCVDPERRRVPSTRRRIALYRWKAGG